MKKNAIKLIEKIVLESIYTSQKPKPRFKKGDKVKTRDGDIETVLRINSNGNVETVENDYSWPPDSLTLMKK